MIRCGFLVLVLVCVPAADAVAQVVSGRVVDDASGEGLPAATVQLAGTYRGTITNNMGQFQLALDEFPVSLVFRFIGYRTDTLVVQTADPVLVRLAPVAMPMEEIVVSGEDPAIDIMRQVIKRKQQWQADFESYEAQAYGRMTFSNDTSIVAIVEAVHTVWWHRERGMREIKRASRDTGNVPFGEEMPVAILTNNLYDDNIEIAGHRLAGVTHPDALAVYDFSLIGTRRQDDALVYDIAVELKRATSSGFVGRVSVLDEAFAMVEAELSPGPAFLFPMPISRYDATYRQQFSNFGSDVWLPVDLRSDQAVRINVGGLLTLPTVFVSQVYRFTDYQVNAPIPEDLYAETDLIQVDSVAMADGEALNQDAITVPLDSVEARAYATIDSTQTLLDGYQPGGPLGRMIREAEQNEGRGVELPAWLIRFIPTLNYTRVDGVYVGLHEQWRASDRIRLDTRIGISTAMREPERWSYGGGLEFDVRDQGGPMLAVNYDARTATNYESLAYSPLSNAANLFLTGRDDYYDYHRSEGWDLALRQSLLNNRLRWELRFLRADHSSLPLRTSYDLRGRKPPQRDNPQIADGRLQSVLLTAQYQKQPEAGLILASNELVVTSEFTLPGSDYRFGRHEIQGTWHLITLARRRLMPSFLKVGARIGWTTNADALPAQRVFITEGGTFRLRRFATLRTHSGLPYIGRKVAAVYWQHAFRTLPFEIVRLRMLAERGYGFTVFGGHAWTETNMSDYSSWIQHHEVGISLSGIMGVGRVDYTWRLDAPGRAFTYGVAILL